MILPLLFAAQAAAVPAPAPTEDARPEEIVVTASLRPIPEEESPATVTVIDEERIEALGLPLTQDLLRLVPGVSVATSGPPGTQAQVRIRGAEANHTLLLIDGIRFNDPASGNEPRFELLSNEGVRRIEVVRGPQSALYGAEAIGGVVALYTNPEKMGPDEIGTRGSALFEAGSHDFFRGSGRIGFGTSDRSLGLYGGFQRSSGIDSVGQSGERDGYENATIGGSARVQASEAVGVRFAGRYVNAISEFDGSDPLTFMRANTLDESRNQIGALRVAADIAPAGSGLNLTFGGTLLDSTNRNRLGAVRINQTEGHRRSVDALGSLDLATGPVAHRFSLAADYEDEGFRATDQSFGGGTNQERSRERTAIVGEWRASLGDRLTTDIAVRHDAFEGFANATTLRASALLDIAGPLSALVSYSEGIARPTFFDLFGFFPGRFVGNPDLKPERSRGFEAGLRYRTDHVALGLTGYRQRLRDEIVGTFNSTTFLSGVANATGTSRRQGVEIEGEWRPIDTFSVTASYSFADAEDQQVREGLLLREVRRPRHSASLGLDGRWGRIRAGAAFAYVGERQDLDFDAFPARRVTLQDYVLAEARLAYRISDRLEAFGRIANAFDADYRDVVGYETKGRTAYAGIRLAFGD
ncbi:MAG: Outer membrane vitamin B12 receptor BtuB [uncultured Sphingosinicella sp.]|uniref:Outer membrane vitamin B12 receptor BtuB n=1 Tax=uncultured Sphingosinicella sp. TaxID=478748 RepID=A0A6J4UFA8_9SPHN|nr:TonB-dependent receptor [uncultured Sphingosinicella sp.]CAA9546913.1 MAG: Outer membrane vitamin B12 receptor BtuB [uncultured Sphingosinicella sp.]